MLHQSHVVLCSLIIVFKEVPASKLVKILIFYTLVFAPMLTKSFVRREWFLH